jgi:hypothetical protein
MTRPVYRIGSVNAGLPSTPARGLCFFLISVFLSPLLAWCQNSSVFEVQANQAAARPSDIAEAIRKVCPDEAIRRTEEGSVAGCAECPPGTAMRGEKGIDWELKHAIAGHFTSPISETLLLGGIGCEPHSLSFGGTFVFALELGKPRLLDYREGLIIENCQKLPLRDRRDFLVCNDRWGAQGYETSYLYDVVFDSTGKSAVQAVLETDDNVKTCGAGPDGNFLGPVQHSSIKAVRFRNVNGPGPLDMLATVALGKRVLTKAESDACLKRIANPSLRDALVPVRTKDYQLRFLFDGKRFTATHTSRAIRKLFPEPHYPLGIAE